MKIFQLICFIYLVFSNVSCRDKPDYQDEFQERILLQLLIEPAPNPIGNCRSYYDTMGNCLSRSTNPTGAVDSLNLARTFVFATESRTSTASSLEEVCAEISNGIFFSRFTDKAKDCVLSCQRNTWRDLESNNQCGIEYANLFTVQLESSRLSSCLIECGQINNTDEF